MMTRTGIAVGLSCTLLVGCVSRGKYDAALGDAQKAHAELGATRGDAARRVAAKDAELSRIREEAALVQDRYEKTYLELQRNRGSERECRKALDDSTAMDSE